MRLPFGAEKMNRTDVLAVLREYGR